MQFSNRFSNTELHIRDGIFAGFLKNWQHVLSNLIFTQLRGNSVQGINTAHPIEIPLFVGVINFMNLWNEVSYDPISFKNLNKLPNFFDSEVSGSSSSFCQEVKEDFFEL